LASQRDKLFSMPIDESQIRPVIARLRDSIDDELRTQFGMRRIDVPLDTIREIAYWVAVQLDYAYEFEWSPRWEGKGLLNNPTTETHLPGEVPLQPCQ
jgi:hypothetical protein